MRLPSLSAGVRSLATGTAIRYRMTAISTSNGFVWPQQTDTMGASPFGICVADYGACYEQCAGQGFPFGCVDLCEEGFATCASEVGEGDRSNPGSGAPTTVESSGCFRDRTSSTGWRLRECTTVIGLGRNCTWSDECPAPGCGPCRCVCTQQCFRYGPTLGETIVYSPRCSPPFGGSGGRLRRTSAGQFGSG